MKMKGYKYISYCRQIFRVSRKQFFNLISFNLTQHIGSFPVLKALTLSNPLSQFQRYQYVRLPALRRSMRHSCTLYANEEVEWRTHRDTLLVILAHRNKKTSLDIVRYTKRVSMKRHISLHLLSTAITRPPGGQSDSYFRRPY